MKKLTIFFLLSTSLVQAKPNKEDLKTLSDAIFWRNTERVKELLPTASEGEKTEALISAAYGGKKDIVELILATGTNVNAKSESDRTALMCAADTRDFNNALVKVLLEAGADPNLQDKYGDTALMLATYKRQKAIIELLLAAGANVNAHDNYGTTALIQAVFEDYERDQPDIIELLVNAGADVNANTNSTALVHAVYNNYARKADRLIASGADLEVRVFIDQQTPLMIAAENGNISISEKLLAAGADITARDRWDKRTAVDIAIKKHGAHSEIARMLSNVLLETLRQKNEKFHNCVSPF